MSRLQKWFTASFLFSFWLVAFAVSLPDIAVAQEAEIQEGPSRILVLGDSHMTGYFGRYLHKTLRERLPAASVYTVGACGRGSPGFMKGGKAHCGLKTIDYRGRRRIAKGCKKNPCTEKDGPACERNACRIPSLDLLLKEHQPEVTIVQLGGNSWFLGSVEDGWAKVRPHIEGLANKVVASGSRCLWVSPSDSLRRPKQKNRDFTAFLKEALAGKCEVFVSLPEVRPYLDYRTLVKKSKLTREDYDGVHYGYFGASGRKAQRRWGNDIIDAALQLGD